VVLDQTGPQGVSRNTVDDTREMLAISDPEEGRGVAGMDSLGASSPDDSITVLGAIHVRRKVAAALCRLSWRQDRALTAVQAACLALGQLTSPAQMDPPTMKIATTGLANMLRHPGGAAFAVADGALVALSLAAVDVTSLEGEVLDETNEDGVVRNNRLWLQLCDRERPLIAVSLYNASCHASSRRMMLKLTDADAQKQAAMSAAGRRIIVAGHEAEPLKPQQPKDSSSTEELRDAGNADSDAAEAVSAPAVKALIALGALAGLVIAEERRWRQQSEDAAGAAIHVDDADEALDRLRVSV